MSPEQEAASLLLGLINRSMSVLGLVEGGERTLVNRVSGYL
jgi:hypothetical protein